MIRFTNYKRIYIILGVFVFLLVSLYVVSAVVKRSREGNEGVQNTSNTTSGGAGTNEDITNEKQYLTDKTTYLIKSMSENSDSYFSDPVFSGTESRVLNFINSEVKKYGTPIQVNGVLPSIDSDDLTGIVMIQVAGSFENQNPVWEFFYMKDAANNWKLYDFYTF